MDLLGAAVKRQRLRLRLTQLDIEHLTGIDQTTISRFENGRRCGIRWSKFARLVAVLGGLDFSPPPAAGMTGIDHQRTTPNPYLQRLSEAIEPGHPAGSDH